MKLLIQNFLCGQQSKNRKTMMTMIVRGRNLSLWGPGMRHVRARFNSESIDIYQSRLERWVKKRRDWLRPYCTRRKRLVVSKPTSVGPGQRHEGLRTYLFLGDGDQVWNRARCEETDEIISRDGKDRFNAEEASKQTKKTKKTKEKKRKKQKRYFRNGDETKATVKGPTRSVKWSQPLKI